jgi:hypothetical protein
LFKALLKREFWGGICHQPMVSQRREIRLRLKFKLTHYLRHATITRAILPTLPM